MYRWAAALSLSVLAGCATAPLPGAPALPPPNPSPAPVTMLARVPAPGQPPPGLLAAAASPKAGAPDAGLAPAHDEEPAADDDDDEDGARGPGSAPAASLALLLSDAEIEQRFRQNPASLGSASVGPASGGALVNGVQMPAGEHWQLTDPGRAWGTQETVDALVRCIERVNQRFPGAPPLSIGHLSARSGGHLSPHKSHQSGRDADIGYYYRVGTRPFVHATEENLDLPRTWVLVKTALKETSIDMIFMDHAVQRTLADFATRSGEDPAFVDEVFQVRGRNARAPIRHVKGHDNHIHFRFHNPVAEAMGQRVARFVVIPHSAPRLNAGAPAAVVAARQAETAGYAEIRARSGDTLVILARRYGTTVEEIQRVNRLPGNAIRAGMVYRIPQKVAPRPPARVAQRKPAPSKPAGAKPAASAPEP
jgi:murein endopeptidase